LPVLHGPFSSGLSVSIKDADTQKVAAVIPMLDFETQWLYWRVMLDRAIKHVQIIAENRGQRPYQWLALADPAQCR
jgi:hypothetical protein